MMKIAVEMLNTSVSPLIAASHNSQQRPRAVTPSLGCEEAPCPPYRHLTCTHWIMDHQCSLLDSSSKRMLEEVHIFKIVFIKKYIVALFLKI
jgi:hypothetical protein